MKPHTSWGYEHYKPLFYASGDIYICRIAPFAGGFTFDTKEYPDTAFEVYLRKRSETEFTCVGMMTGRTFMYVKTGKRAVSGLCGPERESATAM